MARTPHPGRTDCCGSKRAIAGQPHHGLTALARLLARLAAREHASVSSATTLEIDEPVQEK